MRLMAIRNEPNEIISTNGELGLYKWYQIQTPDDVLVRTLGLKGWIVRSHIGSRGERNISYKGVETSP